MAGLLAERHQIHAVGGSPTLDPVAQRADVDPIARYAVLDEIGPDRDGARQ